MSYIFKNCYIMSSLYPYVLELDKKNQMYYDLSMQATSQYPLFLALWQIHYYNLRELKCIYIYIYIYCSVATKMIHWYSQGSEHISCMHHPSLKSWVLMLTKGTVDPIALAELRQIEWFSFILFSLIEHSLSV